MTRFRSLVASLAVAILLGSCSAGTARVSEDGSRTLTIADSFPAEHPISAGGAAFLMQRANEISNDSLDFDYFPAEQMGAADDLLDHARTGVVDISLIAPAYVPAQLPLSSVADLPGLTDTPCHTARVVEELVSDSGTLYEEEFAKRGVRPLAVGVIPEYEVLTGDRVVREPADIQGLQMRSAGGATDHTVQALGAAPVAMPATEMYEGISRGTVDGTVLAPMSAEPYKLDEAARHSTSGAQLGGWTMTYSIAESTWRQLPPDARHALEAAGKDTTRNLCRTIAAENRKARAEMGTNGMRFHELTDDERRQWRLATQPVRHEWAHDIESLGLPGNRVLNEFHQARERLAP